jgi:hypothetical protein
VRTGPFELKSSRGMHQHLAIAKPPQLTVEGVEVIGQR